MNDEQKTKLQNIQPPRHSTGTDIPLSAYHVYQGEQAKIRKDRKKDIQWLITIFIAIIALIRASWTDILGFLDKVAQLWK